MDRINDIIEDGFIEVSNDDISNMISDNMSTMMHLLTISRDKIVRGEDPSKIHARVHQLIQQNNYLRSQEQ